MTRLYATLYSRPNGQKSLVKLIGAEQDDVEWFTKNKIHLSVEAITGEFGPEYVVYGLWPDQDEDNECLVTSSRGTTAETFKNLRKQLEQFKP